MKEHLHKGEKYLVLNAKISLMHNYRNTKKENRFYCQTVTWPVVMINLKLIDLLSVYIYFYAWGTRRGYRIENHKSGIKEETNRKEKNRHNK